MFYHSRATAFEVALCKVRDGTFVHMNEIMNMFSMKRKKRTFLRMKFEHIIIYSLYIRVLYIFSCPVFIQLLVDTC